MKATEFNVHNIKDKYNFKSSEDFLLFLEKQLKIKEEEKAEAMNLLDEIDYQFSGIEEEIKDQDFIEFTRRARIGAQKRLDRINLGINALKNDIEIVKRIKN